MKYQIGPVHAQNQTEYTWEDILQAKVDLQVAYENLGQTERQLREIDDLMCNAMRSLDLLSKFGSDMIPQLNLDGGLETLCGVQESLITVEKATERLMDSVKEGIKKFIAWVKDLFGRIRIWIKNFINRLRGNSGVKISDIIRKSGNESKVREITSKLIDKETVVNIGRLVSESAQCKSVIAQVVTLTNVDEVRDISNKLFFDETSSGVAVKTKNYIQSNGNFKRLNNDGSLFKNHNSRLTGTGVDINEIQTLENSILNLANELSSFESVCDSAKNKIISRLETMNEKSDEYHVLKEIVSVLMSAIKRNAAFCGILKADIDGIFKKLSENSLDEGSSQTQSISKDTALPKDFKEAVTNHDRTRIIADIVFYLGELDEGTMTDMELPVKAFNAASKEFKAANIELEQDDNGEWLQSIGGIPEDPAQWNHDHFEKMKNLLRHRFCKRYLDLAMKVLKHLKNKNGSEGGLLPNVNLKSVQDARVDILQVASDDRHREKPIAVTCAIQADKYFKRKGETLLVADDGLYMNDPATEQTWKTLRGALWETFSIEKLKRMQEIVLSLRKAGNANFQVKS